MLARLLACLVRAYKAVSAREVGLARDSPSSCVPLTGHCVLSRVITLSLATRCTPDSQSEAVSAHILEYFHIIAALDWSHQQPSVQSDTDCCICRSARVQRAPGQLTVPSSSRWELAGLYLSSIIAPQTTPSPRTILPPFSISTSRLRVVREATDSSCSPSTALSI